MSQLKFELLNLFSELSGNAKTLKGESARKRWRVIRYVAQSSFTVRKACMAVGVSEDYFYKWAKVLLKSRSLASLQGLSKAPKRRPKRIRRVWEDRIVRLREARPYEGCERIAARIEEIWGKRLAPSTVNRVLRTHGLISAKVTKSLQKKHLRRYRRPLPGYLQMDFKYVPYRISGKQYYQLSCVDHHSTWRMIRVYENKDLGAVESFLHELERECPFPIIQIQTDNDLAFTHKFWRLHMGCDPTFEHPLSVWCKANGVEHKLIPVGVKELNGKVENTHKQDDRELYSQINPADLTQLQARVLAYEQRWNEQRKTRALNWKTPMETLRVAYAMAIIYCRKWGTELRNVILVPKQKKTQCQKKRKRKSAVSRYLEWLEKDAQKYGT